MLLDLRRRVEDREDIGSRVEQIRRAAAVMRACTGGFRRVSDAPDGRLAAEPDLMAKAREILALAERNVDKADEILGLLEDGTLAPPSEDDTLGPGRASPRPCAAMRPAPFVE